MVCVPMQIDLRFTNPEQGSLAVVVAPVLRFIDVGFNADIRIEELGSPEKLIGGFAPELFGSPLQVLIAIQPPRLHCCMSLQQSDNLSSSAGLSAQLFQA